MKKVFALFLALTMLLGLAACTPAKGGETTAPSGSQGTGDAGEVLKSFTVTVVHSDGTSKVFEYTTAEEFLGPVLEEVGLIQGHVCCRQGGELRGQRRYRQNGGQKQCQRQAEAPLKF